MITVITSFGRGGSSATCGMLDAGGMAVAGVYPDYEPHGQTNDVSAYEGGAVKILDLFAHIPQKGPEYRVILLQRNLREQAKSFVKMMRNWHKGKVRGGLSRHAVRNAERFMRQKTPHLIAAADRVSAIPALRLTYEELVGEPLQTALRIRDYLERDDLDVKQMAKFVHKRPATCHPYMVENTLKRGPSLTPIIPGD